MRLEAAGIAATEAAARAREKALDPTLPAPDIEAARHESESARFNCDRMKAAVAQSSDQAVVEVVTAFLSRDALGSPRQICRGFLF